MKRIHILIAALMLVPSVSRAQQETVDVGNDIRGRFSVEIDRKLAKGLHVFAEGEVRAYDNFGTFKRYSGSLGMSYKINSYLKTGVSYTFFNQVNGTGEWVPRHRMNMDLTGSLKTGFWRFSLRERVQVTNKTGSLNPYQTVRNQVALRSRLKASYRGFSAIEPYAFVEVRNVLNDPRCSATYSLSTETYSDYQFLGYDDVYLNRVRSALGLEWSLSLQHTLDFFLFGDWCKEKEVDTNKEGTKLKSLTWEKGFNTTIGVTYKFSF